MKALPLLLLPVLGQLAWGKSLCPVDEAIHEKIRDGAGPLILETMRNFGLSCRTVTSRGDLATCPAGEASWEQGAPCGGWGQWCGARCHQGLCYSRRWGGLASQVGMMMSVVLVLVEVLVKVWVMVMVER
uniref:Resistin n=1 Tax=Ursus maritimus TaxID=29073 RepID=A0A452UI18_URSMA